MELNNDQKTIISQLRREIQEKDADIHTAAQYGKQLLDEKDKLKRALQDIECQVEVLEQEKYTLQLDLDNCRHTTKSQASEIETSHANESELTRRVQALEKENATWRQKFDSIKKEKTFLERSQEDSTLVKSSLKNKIEILEEQVKRLQQAAAAAASLNETKNATIIEDIDVDAIMEENKSLQDLISKLQFELESNKLQETRLANRVEELKMDIHEKQKDISEYMNEIQVLKEENVQLRSEIELMKMDQVDVNRKGNSVFGELDDRRKLVEKEYKLLRKRYETLKSHYEDNKNELLGCKGQVTMLLSTQSRKHHETYIEKLENSLSRSKAEVESLTVKISKLTKDQHLKDAQQMHSNTNEYDYLRVMLQQSEKKVKELEKEVVNLRMQKAMDGDKLTDAQRSLFLAREQLESAKSANRELRQQIAQSPELSPSFEPKVLTETQNIQVVKAEKHDISTTKHKHSDTNPNKLCSSDVENCVSSVPSETVKALKNNVKPKSEIDGGCAQQ